MKVNCLFIVFWETMFLNEQHSTCFLDNNDGYVVPVDITLEILKWQVTGLPDESIFLEEYI